MKRLAILLLFALTAASQSAPVVSWYRIALHDGPAIGHSSVTITETAEGREIVTMQRLTVQEDGDPATVLTGETVVRQDRAGRTLSISDYSQTGRDWTRTVAKIAPGRAEITRSTKSDRHALTVPLPSDVRFDAGSGLLRSWDPARTPLLEFRNFSIDAMAVERMTIERAPGGDASALIRKRYDGPDLRGVARLTLDAERRIASVTQPMFGASVTTAAVDRETALAPHPPFRVLANIRIKSPFRIADAATRGHIRYRFGFVDGIAFAPPATGEQRVTLDETGLTLDICEECGPGLPRDADYLRDATRPTAWLQAHHPRIRAIAQPVARSGLTPARKMERLTTITTGIIEQVDFAGHYTALQALERRKGDCGETAVLLAALGRAAGIPTRVVNGLVYSRQRYHGVSNAFMPHSWVLAYVDGRWRSYDAALGAFDSTHIALSVGDGDARSGAAANQLAGLLIWQTMAEIRTRP